MTKVTASAYLNTQEFDKKYESVVSKAEALSKKKIEIGLTANEKAIDKTIQTFQKYINTLDQKDKLEQKKMSGNWTQQEEKGLQSITRSLGQQNTHLNKQLKTLESINPMLAQQLRGAQQLRQENIKINQTIAQQSRNQAIMAKQEKSDLAQLKVLNNERASLEKKMLQSEYNNTQAKKMTNKELDYSVARLKEIDTQINNIAKRNVGNAEIGKELAWGDNKVAYQQAVVPQKANYKELIDLTKQYYAYEKRLIDLQSNPKQLNLHKEEISALEKEMKETKKLIDIRKQSNVDGTKLTNDQIKYQEKLASELQRSNNLYKAQRTDIVNAKNATSEFGDTIKKVFNYILVYKGFQLITQGVQQAIDTMKELDAAFTDIQMVTGDTDEATAQLAQEYNQLAKNLGSTTSDVAAGAAEWFNESRDHLKLFELLETRKGQLATA